MIRVAVAVLVAKEGEGVGVSATAIARRTSYVLLYRTVLLLMVQKSGQPVGSVPHYLQSFIHSRWLFGISEPSTVLLLFLYCYSVS